MGQWSDVNQLQAKIAKAEGEYRALCDKCANARVEREIKKKELVALYEEQDRTVKGILGPRTLWEDEKKILEGKT